jgi:serine/threonine-protein kinase
LHWPHVIAARIIAGGVLRKREGDLTGARNDYDEAIALNPIKSSYFRNRANLRRPLGDLEGSMEDYNQALSVNQNDSIAYNIRAIVKEEMGDLEGPKRILIER